MTEHDESCPCPDEVQEDTPSDLDIEPEASQEDPPVIEDDSKPEVKADPVPEETCERDVCKDAMDAYTNLVGALGALKETPESISAKRRAQEVYNSLVNHRE